MAGNRTLIVNGFKTASENAIQNSINGVTPDAVQTAYANEIADAIDAYVKTLDIIIPAGAINVAGSSTAQSNPAPIPINDAIS